MQVQIGIQEEALAILPDLELALRPTTKTVARLSPLVQPNFSFVPLDGQFGANRTLPGVYALGDISMRLRPTAHQAITLPPFAYVREFPAFTELTTANGNPGAWGLTSTGMIPFAESLTGRMRETWG